MFEFLKSPADQRWITVYFHLTMPHSKVLAKKIREFLEEHKWELFVSRNKTNQLTTGKVTGKEIHLSPNYKAELSPKELIKLHYKLIDFSKVISKHLKLEKPSYITEIMPKGKTKNVVHRYGTLCIIYDIKDRARFEKDPDFFGLSNKMFVESIEEIKKHI